MPDSPYWKIKSVPANLPDDVEKFVVECCLKLFERLECRDYSRFDWRIDAQGNPKILEVNPNPGWCWDGHLAKMSKITGLSYSQMLGEILRAAEERLSTQTSTDKDLTNDAPCRAIQSIPENNRKAETKQNSVSGRQ